MTEMTGGKNVFEKLEAMSKHAGSLQTLDFLADYFRKNQMYGELFEALKMKSRLSLDLPMLYGEEPDELSEQHQLKLEDKLLDACREVGTLLVREGRIAEGWMYLQPLADRHYVAGLIKEIEVSEENVDIVIDIALRQSVAPEYGYQLILEHHGTCNSITTLDTYATGFSRPLQEKLSAMLVEHVYQELQANLVRHVGQHESSEPKEARISDLIAHRDWLFNNGGHHLDVTHLASVMRIARLTGDVGAIRKAAEMAEYGNRLAADFQFPGQPPFQDTYPDHAIFFRALLGENVERAIEHFRAKAISEMTDQTGTLATEHFVALLDRLGRHEMAIEIATQHLSDSSQRLGIAPSLVEIAKTHEDYQVLMRHYQVQQDVLGFAVSLLLDHKKTARSD